MRPIDTLRVFACYRTSTRAPCLTSRALSDIRVLANVIEWVQSEVVGGRRQLLRGQPISSRCMILCDQQYSLLYALVRRHAVRPWLRATKVQGPHSRTSAIRTAQCGTEGWLVKTSSLADRRIKECPSIDDRLAMCATTAWVARIVVVTVAPCGCPFVLECGAVYVAMFERAHSPAREAKRVTPFLTSLNSRPDAVSPRRQVSDARFQSAFQRQGRTSKPAARRHERVATTRRLSSYQDDP